MGIYFNNTTAEEDKLFILEGIEKGIITKDFYWADFEDPDPKNEKNLVWISLDDPRHHLLERDYNSFCEIITINGIQGRLTKKGCSYINICLMKVGKFSSIY